VINPNGYVLYDIALQQAETQTQGTFEAVGWGPKEALFLLKPIADNFVTEYKALF